MNVQERVQAERARVRQEEEESAAQDQAGRLGEVGVGAQDLIDRAYDTQDGRLNLRPFIRYAGNSDIPTESEEEQLRHIKELILLGYRPTYLESEPARGNVVAIAAKMNMDQRFEGELYQFVPPEDEPAVNAAERSALYLESFTTNHSAPYSLPINPYLQKMPVQNIGLSDYYHAPLVPEMYDQIQTAAALNGWPSAFEGADAYV